MKGAIVLQPMDARRDGAGVARIRTACFPAWPVTADDVVESEARRPPSRWHEAWVASDGNEIAGYGYVEEPGVAAAPGRVHIRVLVAPAQRRRGVGGALYDRLLQRAAGGTEFVTEAQADATDAHRFLKNRGFIEYHTRLESRLALANVDPARIARGIEGLTDAFFPAGVRIATYRQLLLAVPGAARRLYDLDSLLWSDVPFGLTGAFPTFEEYQAMELGDPDFLPQATFVALDGDRWIGLGALMNGPGFLLNSITGVAREWRGRGLARWLKLHTIRWALERNAAELRTFNDAVNDAILALNRSLGFRIESVEVRYRKDVR